MAMRSSGISELEGPIAEQELFHRRLKAAEEAVKRWVLRSASDAGGGVSDSHELAAAVRELVSLSSHDGSNDQRAKIALQEAMVHLEDEFCQILISGTYFLPPDNLQASLRDSIALPARSSSSSFLNLDALSISSFTTTRTDDSQTYCSGFTRDSVSMEKVHLYLIDPEASILLKEIAELIILADHAPTLCRLYSEIRHSTLMQCLYLLGVQSESEDILERGCNMRLDSRNVKMWIQGLKTFVCTVLPEERHACAQIFGCNNMVEQNCFARATTRCTQELLAVGSAIAKAKDHHYEKIPLLLQMHEELAKLQPCLQDMLSGDARDMIGQEASMLIGKIGEATLGVLLDFLSLRFNHRLDERPALDGNILPFTQFVVGFIKVLDEYSNSLNLILLLEEEEENGIESTRMAPWECYVLRLLSHLQLKIMGESKFYEDERLRYIFLMNNAMFVLEHLRSLVLRMSLRNDQTHEKLVLLVEEYATAYLRATWSAAVFLLRLQEWSLPQDKRMKERLKKFNSALEEIRRVQTTWKVPNPQLRQHLRIVILHQVFPAYRSYLKRCGCLLSVNPGKNIKYSPEEIENLVLDLFEG